MPFRDRTEAGRRLAKRLRSHAGQDVVVLGLARGGLPVALEIARALDAPLDVFVVRKLGAPGQDELAMGAIASGGVRVLNRELIRALGVQQEQIEAIARREQQELERRERAYRAGLPPEPLKGRTVVVVDDGVATGASLRAALEAVALHGAARVVAAVPVAPPDTARALEAYADEVVCLETPEPFYAVSAWYGSFPQLDDEDVREILQSGRAEPV